MVTASSSPPPSTGGALSPPQAIPGTVDPFAGDPLALAERVIDDLSPGQRHDMAVMIVGILSDLAPAAGPLDAGLRARMVALVETLERRR